MPRPKLSRTIQSPPLIEEFNPHGTESTGEVVLSFEEFEAIRLVDFESLDQSQASVNMGISRQTFGRVLRSARFIISKALVKGYQLKVTGGCYQVRGYGRGQGRGPGNQRHRQCRNSTIEQQHEPTGDMKMNDTNKPSQQKENTEKSNQEPGSVPGQAQGQGRGQGKGAGMGRGKGGGQGRGRGLGGGKGDGSCRRS